MDSRHDLLTEQEVADILRQKVKTLQARRVSGGGIPFVKIGRNVRYRRCDVDTFLQANLRTSTTVEAREP